MNSDYETLDNKSAVINHDFPSIFTDIFKKINIKVSVLLGLITCIILSDSFIQILSTFGEKYVLGGDTTNIGTLIQVILIVLGYIIIDLLNKSKIV